MGSNCSSCKKSSNQKKHRSSNSDKNSTLNYNENKNNVLNQLRNYNFFKSTKSKNDFFIECDLLSINTEELENIGKYFEKWIQIISLTRTEKKQSYQNLIPEKDKLENKENTKKFNPILSNTNNREIKVYNGKDNFLSDLVVKLQIAFMYNKDRFIKYLSKS